MDGEGAGFTFPSSSDYPKGQDATDISWADIFLDGIHSDDQGTTEAGGISTDTSNLAASIQGSAQQFLHQQQPSMIGGQLQIHIPTHLQGSLTSNAVQQTNTNLCGTVAYLTPSVSTHQQVGTTGRIQNVVTVAGQHQMAASVGQQQHQGNTKLVQIASSFPMASVQQLASGVPIQTILQPNQTLTGQTIYGSQGTGLFPAQGSVHIENPKVVNVNFGPHVIGSDGSGQQAIIQTAEGKRVLITNSQLQHIPQSISLTQPLVGTQLINSAGGSVIRASMAPGTHTIMSASGTGTQQIVLPSGQTVIQRQANNAQGGIAKNVVLRPVGQNMPPVIYQSGQAGQLIHSQPTLITSSGGGLQVVNAGGGQGGQVQLIAQPSINQTGIGQQQLNQGAIMNLINNQGVIPSAGNQITGLVPGQNIFVNGQMLNIGQLGGLTVPQLQVQHNPQGGVTLTNINATMAQAAQFQPTAHQLVIQHNGQQQQMLLQPKSTQPPAVVSNTVISQRLNSGLSSSKNAPTPTSNANSASSTPVLTPTPSTPTPTPTPDLMSDSCDSGGKGSQGINILEQALAMSAIDLQSFGDDFNFLDNTDCFASVPPTSVTPVPPLPKPKPQPIKNKLKTSKSKSKTIQPTVNVTVNSSPAPFQQPIQLQNAQGQKVTLSPHQKIITANGQVYVLSANGQQFILQPSVNLVTSQLKPGATMVSSAGNINRTNISIPTSSQMQIKEFGQQDQSSLSSIVGGQLKLSPHNIPLSVLQKSLSSAVSAELDSKFFIKASPDGSGTFKIETTIQSVPTAQIMFTAVSTVNNSPSTISHAPPSQTLASMNETTQVIHGKNKTITTLGGMFFKQEPQETLVKQEPVSDLHQSISHAQDISTSQPTGMNLTNTSLAATTSSVITVSTPLVVSSAFFTDVTTTTTQSHQMTIMSTAPMVDSRQMHVSATRTNQPYSLTISDKSPTQSSTVCQSQSTSTASSTTASATSSLKSNSKEKDPANIKSMIPIKIADSTLMLSLTPGQKERLESELSRMSKKDQEGLLMYQQNIIRRTQQVQQKQMEQQMKQQQKKLQQQQQHSHQPQEFQQLQLEQIQQSQQPQQQSQHLSQQQIQQFSQQQILQQQQSQQQSNQAQSSAKKMNYPSQVNNISEILSPPAVQGGYPTTVQELMEKSEEHDSQQNFQFSTPKLQGQPQQMHQTPPHQQSQQMHQNLHQRTSTLDHNGQQFVIPQLGRCLAEQQLLRDRSLALSPDVNSSFKSLSDAMRRLVRYHTLQDHKPEKGSKTMKTWDTRYDKLCDYLVKKKRCYLRRFSKMQLYKDICPHKRPEHIQNLMCFNEQLRELIENEKEKATNNPDLFEPINPEHLSLSHSYSASAVKASIDDIKCEETLIKDSNGESGSHNFKLEYLEVKGTSIDPEIVMQKPESFYASPSSQKRKLSDKGSTGTLKLVLKRRTTDNFMVKKSLAEAGDFSQTLKPVANLEKSDSEYEFDPQASVTSNQPVIVRQRTLSVASQLTSSDTGSDNGSFISHADKIQDHSSMEEDLEDERDENNEEEDDDEEEVKSSCDEEDSAEQFMEDKKCSKGRFVLLRNEVQDNAIDTNNDDSCSVSTDAFMETDEINLENNSLPHHKRSTVDVSDPSLFRYAAGPGTGIESPLSRKKRTHLSSKSESVTSEDVFNSSLSYSLADSLSAKDLHKYGSLYSNDKRVDLSAFPFETSAIGVSSSFKQRHATSASTLDEYASESSVGNTEKKTDRKYIPNSSLFTTPNKSLLETDAMFNSDDEDEMRSSRKIVSTFEIDNKDPQSSMINDSVRSAINSVLDGDDDDSDDSQTSWASAANRPSSSQTSSVQRNLFHSASSASFTQGHDADLDAAVQSILNS